LIPGEKVNKFTVQAMKELDENWISCNKSEIKALKITSSKEGIFIAGADLHSFEPVLMIQQSC